MLHGLAARWQLFMPLIPALSQEWHVYALDFRGHGSSGRGERYWLEDYVADTVAFLRGIVQEAAVLYGHSLGGWVALVIAATHPELARAVIVGDSALYESTVSPDMAVSYLSNMPMSMRGLAKSQMQMDPGVMDTFRRGELTPTHRPDETYGAISCPVLLLQASSQKGGIMTDQDVRRALPRFSNARHQKFEELGHGLHVENPDAVRDVVEAFLAEV